jgi:signal recognition particle subunit SRP19
VPRAKAVWYPLSKDIVDAATRLGLGALHEAHKAHPRDWENPGRARVQWKKDGRLLNPVIASSACLHMLLPVSSCAASSPLSTRSHPFRSCAEKKLLEMIALQIQRVKTENVPREPYTYPPAPVPPTLKPSKPRVLPVGAKGKGKVPLPPDGGARASKRSGRPLPVPPEPRPSLAVRVAPLSPALPSGVLLDAIKASMNTQQEPGQVGAAQGGMGKGKRKVVRVRQ